jgi:RNA polymerase sigma-70 factor (ECF subfamily)
MDDRGLVERVRAGDSAAFDAIFRQYYAHLVGYVQSLLRDQAAAEEVVQDIMLEFWRRRSTLAADVSLKGYLFQSARNRAFNHARHARIVRQSEPLLVHEQPQPPAADAELAGEELSSAIQSAVAGLPPRCREVFELSRVDGLRYSEIAVALGISVKTVETQMGKALQVLRTRLAAWRPESPSR